MLGPALSSSPPMPARPSQPVPEDMQVAPKPQATMPEFSLQSHVLCTCRTPRERRGCSGLPTHRANCKGLRSVGRYLRALQGGVAGRGMITTRLRDVALCNLVPSPLCAPLLKAAHAMPEHRAWTVPAAVPQLQPSHHAGATGASFPLQQ